MHWLPFVGPCQSTRKNAAEEQANYLWLQRTWNCCRDFTKFNKCLPQGCATHLKQCKNEPAQHTCILCFRKLLFNLDKQSPTGFSGPGSLHSITAAAPYPETAHESLNNESKVLQKGGGRIKIGCKPKGIYYWYCLLQGEEAKKCLNSTILSMHDKLLGN